MITQLQPTIVIPMHYKTDSHKKDIFSDLTDLAHFLKIMGKDTIEPVQKFKLTPKTMPIEQTIVVFE